jgi:uncharacterized protein YcbX
MPDLILTQIWIYPIKSLGGISLNSAKVMRKGLRYDRRWMLVDNDGKFITQRVHPKMALFRLTMDTTQMRIHHKEHSISLLLNHSISSNPLKVQIWGDIVSAFEVSHEHSQWFSEHLGIKCRLVYFPEENARPVDPLYRVSDEQVSLADAYPYLIIGQSSLDDLNSRLAQPISIKRFRPNLVFTGGEPYEEDTWGNFTIGSTQFEGIRPCSRCVLTTVNPETGEKGDEPLRTLATYRKRDNNIYFGQNLIAITPSEVHVGDTITLKNP